ncbi:MAG: carboxyl transferase domain-containing protein [Acidimicrobiia bacterium]|nr:carboxyl transferase domain-containing protein [Acidimicrobiia bacterium]
MSRPRRVLIANRGEIAIRIAEAAASLGIETVAVFVDADEQALHTRLADQRRRLDSPAGDPVAGYLAVDALVAVAIDAGCDAVHPGYGFLAESSVFAAACERAVLTFIGASSAALALFGDKVRARSLATSLGISVVPGSEGPVSSVAEAIAAADEIGSPVMLKAAAGGGGRGIRLVQIAGEMTVEFERCRSEAAAAFGDGTLFVEQVVARPRHVEIQVLADEHGNIAQLGSRDCSVQVRNQKIIEIAPAPGLSTSLRDRLADDAVRLAAAGGLHNAATVEFLVVPERDEYFFIECNPRIQVEHTVTEEVTGIDLVAAQFELAGGATLDELDLDGAGAEVGYAVQARVVATGPGTMQAYREPGGSRVRTDGSGYVGYTPALAFDPLIAKVIGTAGSSLTDALATTDRALARFHIAGIPTNVAALRAVLAEPSVQAGDARTTLLAERPELLDVEATAGPLDALGRSPSISVEEVGSGPTLDVPDGCEAVTAHGSATVIEVLVASGDVVRAGEPMLIASAMKMETVIAAPTAGTIEAMLSLSVGDTIDAGRVLAAIRSSGDDRDDQIDGPWDDTLGEVDRLRQLAAERLAPGSTDPGVVRQRARDKLTCRERLDLLLDEGSFREVGSAAGFASHDADGTIIAFTPANSVGGSGRIESRPVVVCADDFTSRGGHADGAIAAKSVYLDQLSVELRVPSLRLLDGSSGGGSVAAMVPEQKQDGESGAKESTGAIRAGRPRVAGGGGSFLPGHLGSTEYSLQLATVPVVNVLLGSVVGLGAAKAVLGHFSVMVRDISQLFVAGPPVVSHAMGVDVSKEELGGWHIHCTNGSVDNLAETEEEAMEMTRRFLSYLPSSVFESPPSVATTDDATRREEELAWLIPRKRTTTFDMRRAIELMADRDSFFEIGPLWGTDQITGFVRFDGRPMGVIASDSRHLNGGALTADGCDKLTRHLDLCDLFHLPVLNLVDNPGFAVGIEHEKASTIRKGGRWMVAFAQTTVPVFTVIMRRSFGVAGNNWATPRREVSTRVVWPATDAGGIPPEGGIEAAYKRQLAESEDPAALRAELAARIETARGPLGPLSKFQLEEMIDPRDTRPLICEWAETAARVAASTDRFTRGTPQFRP